MRILEFEINGQNISKSKNCDFSGIVPGTAGYLYATFEFSAEWRGLAKVAEFRRYSTDEVFPAKIINGKCEIPADALRGKKWYVNVVGKRGNIRMTTDRAEVKQEG